MMRTARLCLTLLAAALAAAGCSPDAQLPSNQQNASSETAPLQTNGAEPAPAAIAKTEPGAPKSIAASARRCGWLHNPTPGNWWLVDRDGQWILGTQGGEPVAGMDEMPDMSVSGWVETNGHYGYGCACMDMVVDPASGDVLRISKAAPKPLAQCRSDRKLPSPGE
jgi:hypothetical protein